MKKFTVFILAVLYLGLSTGVPVHLHYCMGKLAGSSLGYGTLSGKCSSCGRIKNTKKGCCKEEHQLVKVSQDQDNHVTVYPFLQLSGSAVLQNSFSLPVVTDSSATGKNLTAYTPPPHSPVPIYLFDHIFRI